MAIIYKTTDPIPKIQSHIDWVYNGLDCCLTKEIHEHLEPQVKSNPFWSLIYNFEKAMQAPAMEMTFRGILVDMSERQRLMAEYKSKADRYLAILDEFAIAAWDKPLNPNSPKQLQDFFYGHMRLPPIYKFNKQTGRRSLSTDRKTIEDKLSNYYYAKPFCRVILAYRDVAKKLSTLKTALEADNRFHPSFKVANTDTGRFASARNAFGSASNAQNWTEALRRIFVPDPGFKFAYIDLEQAESRIVGIISYLCSKMALGEKEAYKYLAACIEGDLHSTVCKMVWPKLAWTGDLKHDRYEVAEQKFYRDYSYRDMAKRGGHGSNYYGHWRSMAKHLKVTPQIMEAFQQNYFSAFPSIPEWHGYVIEQVQTTHQLHTILGRERTFWGRASDEATLRAAIAHEPQSIIGDYMNLGMWRVWKSGLVQLLAQVHDAIWFQYPEQDEDWIIPKICEMLEVPIKIADLDLVIPNEASTGWNASKYHAIKNPDGLKKFESHDDRQRSHNPIKLASPKMYLLA